MKISVIIPVYNAEKYLPACLDSILNQTFTDFELLIVDDCSTDSSYAVAESYRERFNGRLKIISLSQNTGNPSIPRNVGLENSRGEYVLFVDNDDLLIQNALEIFYVLAENFRADVVYTERAYICDEFGNVTVAALDKNFSPVDKPTVETNDIAERVQNFLRTSYCWAPWAKFVRREVLTANKIFFPRVTISEDVLWSFKVVCAAKNFLRVSTPLYVHRELKNSWSQIERKPVDELKFWLNPLVKGLEYLDDFMSENDFFAQNSRFEVTNFFVKMQVAGMLGALEKLNRNELYEIIRREFSESRHAALIANLFVFMAYYRDKNRG